MHTMVASWVLTTFPLFFSLIEAQCSGNAVALPIRDVLVDANVANSYITGIPVTVGTTAQDLVVLPWAELNNTYFYDSNTYCDSTVIYSTEICQVRRGGIFQESDSSTWDQKSDIIEAGGARQETDNANAESGIKSLISSSVGGTDVLNLPSVGDVKNFPIGIPRQQWDNGYSTLNPLGLGTNSTILNSLYKAGTIGSRIWSMYWGRQWTQNNPLNGSLVLGGYDQRKVTGQNYTKKLDYSGNCFTGMSTTITDIVLNFRGGSDQSLFSTNDAITACLVPTRQLLFQGPSEVAESFKDYTSMNQTGVSFGVHWAAMQFNGTPIYDGDITFQLDSGIKVRISNDQFVVDNIYYDRSGARLSDNSIKEVLIASLGDSVATLGRYFLTGAYLMVNQDEGTWTLWNANPTSGTSLKSINSQGGNSSCSGSNRNNNGTSSSSDNNSSSSGGLSTGAIVGIVVGVVVVVIFIAVALFGLWRRRRRQTSATAAQTNAHTYPQTSQKPQYGPQELHGVPTTNHQYQHPGGAVGTSEQKFPQAELASGYPHAIQTQPQIYEMPDRSDQPSTPLMESADHR